MLWQGGVRLFSQVKEMGQEEMAPSYTRGGLNWVLGKKNLGRSGGQALEEAAQESVQPPFLEGFKDLWMWHWGHGLWWITDGFSNLYGPTIGVSGVFWGGCGWSPRAQNHS